MANRVKEDEKNERIIRGLLKLSDNRRCINCNSLGPQYVCTNFWTFVCTTCSGIHREFTHRVKSVSMAKFTSQEVAALKEGGNKCAREIYFKEWDQRQTAPDSSNVERLRDFIKHVYVDRRFCGGKPTIGKTIDKDDYENRRTESYQGGSRSPPYEDGYGRRYSEMSSPGARSDDRNSRYSNDGGRSPGYEQDSRQYNDYGRSPSRPGIINDWRREDRFGNGLKTDGDSKVEGRSPEQPKDAGGSSPPVVRPVREILGDNVIPLRISEPPKTIAAKVVDIPAQAQRTASSSSLGSTSANPVEVKVETTASLIDFDDPEPTNNIAPQAPQTTTLQSIGQPENTTSDNNWASFDAAPQVKVSQASSPFESVLSQLSAPSSVPGPLMGGQTAAHVSSLGNAPSMPSNAGAPADAPANSLLMPQPGGAAAAVPRPVLTVPVNGGASFNQVTESGQLRGMQVQQPALFPASSVQSNAQQFASPLETAPGNQPWSSAYPAITSATEVKLSGRKALPEDLFTATYPSYAAPFPGWQTGPPSGLGFPMQYGIAAMPMPTVLQSSKSMNPFDISESAPAQAQSFPSMKSLQGALPNMPPSSGLLHTSSLGTPTSAWMPPQSLPYQAALPSQAPSHAPAMPPGAYMVQQVRTNMAFSGHQGIGGYGDGASFGTANVGQQLASGFAAHAAVRPFPSVGGNPFG